MKIFGPDIEKLRTLAENARQRIGAIPGIVDLQVEKQVLIPQVRVQIDHTRAALYGLTPAAITQTLDSLSNGRRVSQIVDGNRRFDVVVRLSDQNRSTTGLRELLIPTGSGFVPLNAVADVIETDGPNQIQREGKQRRIVIYGNAEGRRDMAEIAADLRLAIAQLGLPQGYGTALEGSFQAEEDSAWRIGGLSIASLAIVFIVLYSRYRSAALALIVMAGIPMALIGSVVALNVAGNRCRSRR